MVSLAELNGLREDLAALRWDVWTSWIDYKLRRRERRLAKRGPSAGGEGAGCPQRKPRLPQDYDVLAVAGAVVDECAWTRVLWGDLSSPLCPED